MNNEIIVSELNNEIIESMIYEIRGVKVMLDFDLARIYGYTTKAFNQQVKNNLGKFPERYRFQLSKDELNSLVRSNFFTSRDSWHSNEGGSKYIPYAFTEQGIYMLMTVLKGELATKQSIILIDTFKQMKDYIVESNNLLSSNELLKLTNKVYETESNTNKNTKDIKDIKKKLAIVMDNFIDKNNKTNYLFVNGKRIEADVFFQDVFKKAKHTIYIIDDYIDVKTLLLLKCINTKVKIIIFTDNKGVNNINKEYINDFKKDTNISINIRENKELHDRYIIIDYNYKAEIMYHSGPSIKDAGSNGGGIDIVNDINIYKDTINKMLVNNKDLEL